MHCPAKMSSMMSATTENPASWSCGRRRRRWRLDWRWFYSVDDRRGTRDGIDPVLCLCNSIDHAWPCRCGRRIVEMSVGTPRKANTFATVTGQPSYRRCRRRHHRMGLNHRKKGTCLFAQSPGESDTWPTEFYFREPSTTPPSQKLHRATAADGSGRSWLSKAWQARMKVRWKKEVENNPIVNVTRRIYNYTNDADGFQSHPRRPNVDLIFWYCWQGFGRVSQPVDKRNNNLKF